MPDHVDVVIVGGGLLGMAHATAALNHGLSVTLVAPDEPAQDRSSDSLVMVTGQRRGREWTQALRSTGFWRQLAPMIGLEIASTGMTMIARRMPALGLIEGFMRTEMGAACQNLSAADIRKRIPGVEGQVTAGFFSPHEFSIDIDKVTELWMQWLRLQPNIRVDNTPLVNIDDAQVETKGGIIHADTQIICPGPATLFNWPERQRRLGLTRVYLRRMIVSDLRIAPLPCAVLTDLSLIQLAGFRDIPTANLLAERLGREQPEQISNGLHLLITPHHDNQILISACLRTDPDVIGVQKIDQLILDEYEQLFGQPPATITSAETLRHLAGQNNDAIVQTLGARARLVLATGDHEAAIAPALAQDTISELF